MIRDEKRNDLAWWYPPLRDAELPVPQTEIVTFSGDLTALLDGETPEGFDGLVMGIEAAARVLADEPPLFLRTGYLSGKHDWEDTCYLASFDPEIIGFHVANLVEASALAGILGLPHDTWAVRTWIDAEPLFRCRAYGNFPVTREFRLFAREGGVEHVQPYWPPDAVEEGNPDDDDWQAKLARASDVDTLEVEVYLLAAQAAAVLERASGEDYWSLDFLQDGARRWWLIDCAEGDLSYRYDPEAP